MNSPAALVKFYLFFALLGTLWAGELPALQVTEVVTGLQRPTSITHATDGSSRLFITEQAGVIRVIENGQLLESAFLDISDKVTRLDPICCDERGMLSAAFPPSFASSRRFYVYYTGGHNEIYISRFKVSEDDPNRADRDSEEVLFRFEHEYENHFGGQLAFHPSDGKLYLSLGDGAGGGNPLRSAQDPESPYGKIWRVDVEGGSEDLELYTIGLRNPWRFSFDRQTADLYVGDVGENQWEEVNRQTHGLVGANFGWSGFEGPRCFEEDACEREDLSPPILMFDHNQGCSVTGGYVYRGGELPALSGIYFFADFCRGKIWGAIERDGVWIQEHVFEDESKNWSAFGEDEAGEIYLLDYLPGTVYKLGIAPPPPPETEPAPEMPEATELPREGKPETSRI